MPAVPTSCIDESVFKSDNQTIKQRLLFASNFYALGMMTADKIDCWIDQLDEVVVKVSCMLIDSR